MRALRVVGLTEDGEVVLEDPVRLERFRVPADERLRAAARGDLSRLGQIAIELESQLRPREIQARIRAGASVEQVAAAAGVPEQKIERFAYPVLLERFRTAENAQRAHPVRAEGPDNRTLGDVVAHTFGLRGQEYEGVRWDSWKGEDGRWVVALSWRAGRSDNRAHWTFQPGAHGGTVTALDEHASDLVEGLPARPLRTVGAVVDMNRPDEEQPPAPSPVEQWRAAASDSYRERMPHEPARPVAERPAARTAPEPWRPAPPAQRQAEPVEARLVEQRTGSHRGAEARPERENGYRSAEWASAEQGQMAERPEPVVPEQARAEQARAEQARSEQVRSEQARPEQVRPEQVRPEQVRPEQARSQQVRPEQAPSELTRPEPARPDPAPWERGRIPDGVRPSTGPAPSGIPSPATPPAEPATAAPEPEATGSEVTGSEVTGSGSPGPEVGGETPAAAPAVAETPAAPTATAPTATAPTATAPTATAPTATADPATADPVAESPAAALGDPGGSVAAPVVAEAPGAAPPAAESPAAAPAPQEPAAEAPAGEAPAAGRRSRKGKPVMPSWDEVLLGVRGPR